MMIGYNRISLFIFVSLYCILVVSSERLSAKSRAQQIVKFSRGGDDADEAIQDTEDESTAETKGDNNNNTAEPNKDEESEMNEETVDSGGNDDKDEEEDEGVEDEGVSVEESSSGEAEAVEIISSNTTVAIQINATQLRLKGKEFHDQGDFEQAAELFQEAADAIRDAGSEEDEALEEYVTCRLHQALCHLKSESYDECVKACTDVLGDESNPTTYSPAARARAYHRRAKAKLALEDSAGALQDARSAAFLGDRRAVAFYGKLMRETSPFMSDDIALQNPSPLSSSSDPSAALLQSILGKSSPSSDIGMPDFNPASLLFGNSKGNNMLNALGSGGKGPSLAKSVVESLYKRLDDESTQVKISSYLQSANKQQLQQLAAMAGVSHMVQDAHLEKLLSVCHGVTPKTIKKTVRTSKRAVYGVKLVRRVLRVINKYKTILIAIMLLQWSKSAFLRPLPTDRRAAKRALKDAMKKNRRP